MASSNALFHLRRAVEEDAPAIARLHVASWRDAYVDLLPASYLASLSVESRTRFWASEIAVLPPARRPLVADEDDELVGFVHAGAARDDDAPSHAGEIYLIYVAREVRSRGLGRDLLAHGERDLRAWHYDLGMLWVLEGNERARKFYERHGWHADGTVKARDFGGNVLNEVRYRKALDTSLFAARRAEASA